MNEHQEISQALKLKSIVEYYAKFPQAMNYAQFEVWIKKILEDSKK